MSEPNDNPERDDDGDAPFVPAEDAGRTDADKYSRDEKVHKGEDELP